MTETMWVAVIGALGIVVGSLLTVFVSYMTARFQKHSRANELRLQFENERKERQIARLIERRSTYLNPVSENLESITKSAHYIEKKLRDLVFLCDPDKALAWINTESLGYLEEMKKSIESISTSTDNIEMLRPKNTDSQLGDFINNVLSLSIAFEREIEKLSKMQIRHSKAYVSDKGLNDVVGNKEISIQCTNVFNLSINLFERIRQSNHRIEQILSGME